MKKNLFIIVLLVFSFACTQTPKRLPHEVSYGFDPERQNANASTYRTSGLCNGLPRVQDVDLAPGFCLGLVDDGEGLEKPRYTLQIDENHLLMVDTGRNWQPNRGKLFLYTRQDNGWTRSLILEIADLDEQKKCILDRPHQLIIGPDNEIYLTAVQCIATVKPFAPKNQMIQVKISELPDGGLHPLKAIAFDTAKNMYMNVGSITDNCETETSANCHELEERALIRKYSRGSNGAYSNNFTVFARGQRNSMSMMWDEKSQSLWTVENSRDYIERLDSALNGYEKPSDEFNVITENDNLDWPYCYDAGLISPEFPYSNCAPFKKPHLLFPAHSAPLGMLMYTGDLFPEWYRNRLLISFHGYKSYGHRIVTYNQDENLLPNGPPLSVVYGWEAAGGRMAGKPVGLTQGLDGSVFITEDTSQKVLQLYYDAAEGNGTPVAELLVGNLQISPSELANSFNRAEERRRVAFEEKLNSPDIPLFTQIQHQVLDQHCARCHAGVNYPGMQILKYDDVGNYRKLKDTLMPLLTGNGMPQMPLGGLPDESREEILALVQSWIDAGSPAP